MGLEIEAIWQEYNQMNHNNLLHEQKTVLFLKRLLEYMQQANFYNYHGIASIESLRQLIKRLEQKRQNQKSAQ